MFQCYDYFTTAPPKINLKSFFVDLIERKNMKKSLEFLNYGQNIFDYMYNRHYATLLVSSFRNYQPFLPLSCEFHFFNLFFLLCYVYLLNANTKWKYTKQFWPFAFEFFILCCFASCSSTTTINEVSEKNEFHLRMVENEIKIEWIATFEFVCKSSSAPSL